MGHVYTLWFDELPEEEVGVKGWKSCCSEIADLLPPPPPHPGNAHE